MTSVFYVKREGRMCGRIKCADNELHIHLFASFNVIDYNFTYLCKDFNYNVSNNHINPDFINDVSVV